MLDTDDQQQRRNQIEMANQQVVPALMNAIGRSTYTATNNHLDLAFANSLKTSFNLGGESTLRGLVTAGGNVINEDSLSLSSVSWRVFIRAQFVSRTIWLQYRFYLGTWGSG